MGGSAGGNSTWCSGELERALSRRHAAVPFVDVVSPARRSIPLTTFEWVSGAIAQTESYDYMLSHFPKTR